MISSVSNNAAALKAFAKQINTSANNLANASSDEFKAARTHITAGKTDQSVATYTTKDNRPGPRVQDPAKADGTLKEISNTDIAQELIQQISAQQGFDANAKAIQTQDQTLGSIIDIMR